MKETTTASHGLTYLIFDKSVKGNYVNWNISHAISGADSSLKSGVYEATINFYRFEPELPIFRLHISWFGRIAFNLNKGLTEQISVY